MPAERGHHRLADYSKTSHPGHAGFLPAKCLLFLRCGDGLLHADQWQDLLATLEEHAQSWWLDKHGPRFSGQKTINKICIPLEKKPTRPEQIMALLYFVPFRNEAACASYKNNGRGKGETKK